MKSIPWSLSNSILVSFSLYDFAIRAAMKPINSISFNKDFIPKI